MMTSKDLGNPGVLYQEDAPAIEQENMRIWAASWSASLSSSDNLSLTFAECPACVSLCEPYTPHSFRSLKNLTVLVSALWLRDLKSDLMKLKESSWSGPEKHPWVQETVKIRSWRNQHQQF